MFLKTTGIDIEIQFNLYKMYFDLYLATKNDKSLEEIRTSIFKLYYPEIKNESETLMNEMEKRLLNDDNPVMRIKTDVTEKINPSLVNTYLNKR